MTLAEYGNKDEDNKLNSINTVNNRYTYKPSLQLSEHVGCLIQLVFGAAYPDNVSRCIGILNLDNKI